MSTVTFIYYHLLYVNGDNKIMNGYLIKALLLQTYQLQLQMIEDMKK
jgi:hypothetical protein